VLNAANEIAVAAFLERRIGFTRIADVVESTLQTLGSAVSPASIEAAVEIDALARRHAAAEVLARAA
jgi:1-deoxy-D-xylulose-5-phosphate reductoisomerase